MDDIEDGSQYIDELFSLEELQDMYENKNEYILVPFTKKRMKYIVCPKSDEEKCFKTYLITDGYFVKIGRAFSVSNRLKSIQNGNPHRLKTVLTIESDIESMLHKYFKNYRKVCEWFDLPSGYIDIVKGICKENNFEYKEF